MIITFPFVALATDIKTFGWYEYVGRRKLVFEDAHPEYELEITKGEKFGVKTAKNKFYVVSEDDPSIVFKLNSDQYDILMEKVLPWSGKIGRVNVGAIAKQEDRKTSPKQAGIREDKKLTQRLVKTNIAGISGIKFLFAQEILPGEMYHYYDAESVLRAYQESKGLNRLAYGQWDKECESKLERKDPSLDVEFGSAKIDGKLHHLLVVIHI